MGLKLVDLFAGAGGLSCGLGMVGFEPVFACEIEEAYSETYKFNHKETPLHVGDIRGLDAKHILEVTGLKPGELDLLAGGPPCQGFSINAPIRTLEDDRNQLVMDFIRIASTLMPKFILIENVTGIISLGDGIIVKNIYSNLQKMGYKVHHRILFAGHYGVPQIRFRTIFLASRTGKLPEFPLPTHNAKSRANFSGAKELCFNLENFKDLALKPAVTVKDAISDLPKITPGLINDLIPYTSLSSSEFQELLRNKSGVVANHYTGKLGSINLQRLKHIPQGGSWRDIPEDLLPLGLKRARKSDHTKRYGRLHPDGLCSTVLTKCDPHWGSFFHPNDDRVITVREAARFQSFPDCFQFLGNLTQQYAQVGNAVPPLLARAIGNKIKEVIE